MNHWLAIAIAIGAEVMATTALKASNEFTRFWPSVLVVLGYGAAFYFMTISLRVFPLGIMYAIWSGLGIVLVSLLAWVFYRQSLDWAAIGGIALIIAGVLVINLFSHSVKH
ncbi:QacE family quaternary ammonium compound efflux SMR transporter [Methylobacillus gramineus]|uniref:DMT family transporter n=1 Tax=Methylobacillus gramineus TaxID=755169 RepID=UPI001CFF9BB3|nr:SMR family transporter [Methylobacillus gramineus]MCB5184730.1 QacE family quaternary ammonium compound efflux SMR transporter [Methylobacillus gramineus]